MCSSSFLVWEWKMHFHLFSLLFSVFNSMLSVSCQYCSTTLQLNTVISTCEIINQILVFWICVPFGIIYRFLETNVEIWNGSSKQWKIRLKLICWIIFIFKNIFCERRLVRAVFFLRARSVQSGPRQIFRWLTLAASHVRRERKQSSFRTKRQMFSLLRSARLPRALCSRCDRDGIFIGLFLLVPYGNSRGFLCRLISGSGLAIFLAACVHAHPVQQ